MNLQSQCDSDNVIIHMQDLPRGIIFALSGQGIKCCFAGRGRKAILFGSFSNHLFVIIRRTSHGTHKYYSGFSSAQ